MTESSANFKQSQKLQKSLPLLMTLIMLLIIVALGSLIIVMAPIKQEDPSFDAKPKTQLDAKEIKRTRQISEYNMAAASSAHRMPKLSIDQLLSSSPKVLSIPDMSYNDVQRGDVILNTHSLFERSGLSSLLDNIGEASSPINFLGIEDTFSKVVIVFDVSASVKNNVEKSGLSMLSLKTETLKLIHNLSANTRFGIIQHSRKFDCFQDKLIPASKRNKETAIKWIQEEFRTNGSSGNGWLRESPDGVQPALKAAFHMSPDVIFLLSDASYQRSKNSGGSENVPWPELEGDIRTLQKDLTKPARIHFIAFSGKEDDLKAAERLCRFNKGSLRQFDSKNL